MPSRGAARTGEVGQGPVRPGKARRGGARSGAAWQGTKVPRDPCGAEGRGAAAAGDLNAKTPAHGARANWNSYLMP